MLPRFCRFARILRPIVITQNSCTRLFASDIVSPHPFTYVYRKFPDHIRKPIYFESHEDDELVAAKAVSLIDKLSRDSETIEGVGKACAIAKNILNSIGIFIKVSK